MAGDRYSIYDQRGIYFCTFTVVQWIDIFSRMVYRDIIVDSLNHCIAHKGFKVYSWVIMTNHVHLIAQAEGKCTFSEVLRDMKKFMAKQVIKTIQEINESRSHWLLDKFAFEAARTNRSKDYKFWQDGNHAIASHIDIFQKIDYIHNNPLRAGWVDNIEDYRYSSARDCLGKKGLVDVTVIGGL